VVLQNSRHIFSRKKLNIRNPAVVEQRIAAIQSAVAFFAEDDGVMIPNQLMRVPI
jgi:hypothetical protein